MTTCNSHLASVEFLLKVLNELDHPEAHLYDIPGIITDQHGAAQLCSWQHEPSQGPGEL